MPGIFISYRRDDSACCAGRLHDLVSDAFGSNLIFMDVHAIRPAEKFASVIARNIASADVVLVVIGKAWLGPRPEPGRRRIDEENDFVRLELEAAIQQDKEIAPILVDGARLPEELPTQFASLLERQAFELDNSDFRGDTEKLIEWLRTRLAPVDNRTKAASAMHLVGWPLSWFAPLTARMGIGRVRLMAAVLLSAVCVLGAVASYQVAYRTAAQRTTEQVTEDYERRRQTEQDSRIYTLEGIVAEGTTPIEGAEVIAASGSQQTTAKTVSDGRYYINLRNLKLLPGDTLKLTVKAQGFRPLNHAFLWIKGPMYRNVLMRDSQTRGRRTSER